MLFFPSLLVFCFFAIKQIIEKIKRKERDSEEINNTLSVGPATCLSPQEKKLCKWPTLYFALIYCSANFIVFYLLQQ